MNQRTDELSAVSRVENFDVAIIGGGINGACLFDLLCRRGYRTILLERGDFGGGTSQASAMMIWGGLLYLRNMDVPSVFNFSRSRDQMIAHMDEWVSSRQFRFLPAQTGLLSKVPILSAMYLYWLIGCFKRARPVVETQFEERKYLRRSRESLLFEEGMLRCSDCRFVLHWLTQNRQSQQKALNYCELVGGDYRKKEGLWHLQAHDRLSGREVELRSKVVVNCGGVWTDRINEMMKIRSPYKHVFSKGVFLGLKKPQEQKSPLVFAQKEHNDVILSVPWGPITLWGPTEETVTDIEKGFEVTTDDISYLLDRHQHHMNFMPEKDDIVSFRCGVRPLAVNVDYFSDSYPLDISRNFKVAVDADSSWVSVYGGKITGCEYLADVAAGKVGQLTPPTMDHSVPAGEDDSSGKSCPTVSFPDLVDEFPTIQWCMEHEHCRTLADYLRRRTNISQWVERQGLGKNNQHEDYLRSLCLVLSGGDARSAEKELQGYKDQVAARFDQLLEQI
ncbi:MAG: FAD-dependent oxidoreductase [Thermodesulfobacteriota bacterium]